MAEDVKVAEMRIGKRKPIKVSAKSYLIDCYYTEKDLSILNKILETDLNDYFHEEILLIACQHEDEFIILTKEYARINVYVFNNKRLTHPKFIAYLQFT